MNDIIKEIEQEQLKAEKGEPAAELPEGKKD